jgi:hypothetical protein
MAETSTTLIVIFIVIASFCITGCIIATMLTYLSYFKQKKEYENEIEHLKKERDICRQMLKRRNTPDG